MSFNVELWSFSKAPNSTAQPTTTSAVFKCVSNDNFNIIEPRIPLNVGAASNPTTYNYAKISVFSRYYWVTRWAFEGGLWVAYMRVDPLASWKSQIGSLSAYVLRSAAAWNGDIVDNLYPTKTPDISYQTIADPWDYALPYGFYVIGIIGSNSQTSYYIMSGTELNSFISYIFSDPFWTDVDDGNSRWKAEFNPMQYVTTLLYFPTPEPSGHTTNQNIFLGYWDTGITGHLLTGGKSYIITPPSATVPSHPQSATRGAYLNHEPYSAFSLTIPPFGIIPIPASRIQTALRALSVTITIDMVTGDACAEVYNDTTGSAITIVRSTIGVPIQLSQVMTKQMSMAITALSPASLASSWLGIPSAVGNMLKNIMPQVQTTGIDGGFSGIFSAPWALVSTFYPLVDEDLADRGRPLCEKRTLSTLAGYQLCADVEVTIACTRDEEQMIKGFLESGYYYE